MKAVYSLAFFMIFFLSVIAETDVIAFVQHYEATGFVNDYANLLNQQQKTDLEQKISAINDSTSIQFTICTIKSLKGYNIKEFAKALGNFWGVGHQQLNNGVLMVTTVAEREIYIGLGEGTEKFIEQDYLTTLIREVIKPAFKKGNFNEGFNLGVEKIYMKLSGSGIDMRAVKAKQKTTKLIYGFGGLLFFGVVVFLLATKKKS